MIELFSDPDLVSKYLLGADTIPESKAENYPVMSGGEVKIEQKLYYPGLFELNTTK